MLGSRRGHWVASHMGAVLDTRISLDVVEGPRQRVVHDPIDTLPELAFARRLRLLQFEDGWDAGGVEQVPGVREFSQRDIGPRRFEFGHIGAAGNNADVVIRGPVKETNGHR